MNTVYTDVYCVLCINAVKTDYTSPLLSVRCRDLPGQEAVTGLHLVCECFVFLALVWMSGVAFLKSAGLDMNGTVLRYLDI